MNRTHTDKLSVQLLHAHTEGGTSQANEDAWGQAGNAVWVIDGATGCGPHYSKADSDAFLFTQILNKALHAHFLNNSTSATKEILESVIVEARTHFLSAIGQKSIPHQHQPSAAFALVRAMEQELEVTLLGDCKVRIEHDRIPIDPLCDQRIQPYENRTLNKVKSLRQQHTKATSDEIRKMLMPTILQNRASMNIDSGYWVMSFEPAAAYQGLTYTLTVQDNDTLVSLSSDGFDRLSDLYGEKLPKLDSLKNGPEAIKSLFRRLRGIEKKDLSCAQYLRAKPHDDATFLLVSIN